MGTKVRSINVYSTYCNLTSRVETNSKRPDMIANALCRVYFFPTAMVIYSFIIKAMIAPKITAYGSTPQRMPPTIIIINAIPLIVLIIRFFIRNRFFLFRFFYVGNFSIFLCPWTKYSLHIFRENNLSVQKQFC